MTSNIITCVQKIKKDSETEMEGMTVTMEATQRVTGLKPKTTGAESSEHCLLSTAARYDKKDLSLKSKLYC